MKYSIIKCVLLVLLPGLAVGCSNPKQVAWLGALSGACRDLRLEAVEGPGSPVERLVAMVGPPDSVMTWHAFIENINNIRGEDSDGRPQRDVILKRIGFKYQGLHYPEWERSGDPYDPEWWRSAALQGAAVYIYSEEKHFWWPQLSLWATHIFVFGDDSLILCTSYRSETQPRSMKWQQLGE